MSLDELNLLGKDYFTADEAAHYCGVSAKQFCDKAWRYGIFPARFMSKSLYRKIDIQRAIEQQWAPLPSGNAARLGSSTTTTALAGASVRALVQSQRNKRKASAARKSTSSPDSPPE